VKKVSNMEKQSSSKTNITVESPTNKDVGKEKLYWNRFYSKSSGVPVSPSQFCVFVSTEVDRNIPIVEFGCGNGRDSFYFANQGFLVFASDISQEAIKSDQGSSGCGAMFWECDCTDAAGVADLILKAREINPTIAVYNRFFLHSIDEHQQQAFFSALGKTLVSGDKLYMEFRCNLDEDLPKVYGKSHYRRYVETKEILLNLTNLGFEIKYEVTGQGMAAYKNEDPFVSRVIATK
jgi:SAM-dependent methyltransferase